MFVTTIIALCISSFTLGLWTSLIFVHKNNDIYSTSEYSSIKNALYEKPYVE